MPKERNYLQGFRFFTSQKDIKFTGISRFKLKSEIPVLMLDPKNLILKKSRRRILNKNFSQNRGLKL